MKWLPIIFRYMSNYPDKNIEKFAEIFKALSNPNRLKIFMHLVSCCIPKVVSDISTSPEPENRACIGELGQDLNIVPSTRTTSKNFVRPDSSTWSAEGRKSSAGLTQHL